MQRDGDFTNEGFGQPTAVVVNAPFARDVGAFVGALWEHRVNVSAKRLCRTEKVADAQRFVAGVAGELGFEPRFSESESDVLPLNYSPTGPVRKPKTGAAETPHMGHDMGQSSRFDKPGGARRSGRPPRSRRYSSDRGQRAGRQ